MVEKLKAWFRNIEKSRTAILLYKDSCRYLYGRQYVCLFASLLALVLALIAEEYYIAVFCVLIFLTVLPSFKYLREKNKIFLYIGVVAFWLFLVFLLLAGIVKFVDIIRSL